MFDFAFMSFSLHNILLPTLQASFLAADNYPPPVAMSTAGASSNSGGAGGGGRKRFGKPAGMLFSIVVSWNLLGNN